MSCRYQLPQLTNSSSIKFATYLRPGATKTSGNVSTDGGVQGLLCSVLQVCFARMQFSLMFARRVAKLCGQS